MFTFCLLETCVSGAPFFSLMPFQQLSCFQYLEFVPLAFRLGLQNARDSVRMSSTTTIRRWSISCDAACWVPVSIDLDRHRARILSIPDVSLAYKSSPVPPLAARASLGVALRSKLLRPSSDKPLHLHRRRTRHITPPDNSPQHAVAAQQP